MKKINSSKKNLITLTVLILLIATGFAFQDSNRINKQLKQTKNDTIPKNYANDNYIDMKELDKAMLDLDKSLKDINWNKISKEIESSLKSIDGAKIKTDVASSLKSIDWDKIRTDVNNSLKEIDMVKINLDIKKAMDDVKVEFNSEEFKKNMEEIKNIDVKKVQGELRKARIELENHKDEIQKEISKAKKEVIKAKGELSEIKEMEGKMEMEGLINKKEGYTIEYKNKELFINGKKQPAEVVEKYLKYFKRDKFKIEKSKDD